MGKKLLQKIKQLINLPPAAENPPLGHRWRPALQKYFPWICLLLLAFVAHGSVPFSRDDVLFQAALDNSNGFDFLKERYETWSSRTLIEGVMIYLLDIDSVPLWKVCNCLLFIPLGMAMGRLVRGGGKKGPRPALQWFLVGLVLLYPYGYDMGTSGWAATTMNYFWPLVFALVAMAPIPKIIGGEKIRWFEYPVYLSCFLYAANAEQTCFILLAVYGLFFLWRLSQKQWEPFFFLMLAMNVLSLLWIMLCPGNKQRTVAELYRFLDYPMLGFWDKVDLGLSSAASQWMLRPNFLFLFFSSMLAVLVWKRYQSPFLRLVGSFPASCGLVFGMFFSFFKEVYPQLEDVAAITEEGVVTVENYLSYKAYLPLFSMGMMVVCVLISFYLLFVGKAAWEGGLAAFVFLLGFASRAMMAFSPTVWASNTRTNIYMDFSLVFCCGWMYEKLPMEENSRRALEWLLGVLAVFSYLIQFVEMQ